ncbi:hypothetical protein ACUY3M_04565 [Corynebacterium suicordis]|uniref:Uncharacterized protein n=1 Tax=Corynebacterium suicordis DSM 45110 TaxID=1121369 RepID=A0ABR9ZJ00_9CORY|nr:hypothetical protein [Corynebacterium suicordis]MBF4553354.1 hypothetical protein [Corynebacterium suicordis DSM 45110]MDR6277673.1 hypothetical protein [Corynebacterium suicordis]
MSILWATRGKDWGFRFLLDGGHSQPLKMYSEAFGNSHIRRELCDVNKEYTAVRFEDPEGRKDSAGRVIPHDFIVAGDMAQGVVSLEEAKKIIWPLVAEKYAQIWDKDSPAT